MSNSLVTIKTFPNKFEADVIITKLAQEGIASIITNQDTVIADPSSVLHGRFDLKVQREDAEKALEIISEK